MEKNSLRIIDVVFNRINGGSFSVTVCHENASYKSNTSIINWMLSQEERMQLNTPYPYREFERKELLVEEMRFAEETGEKIKAAILFCFSLNIFIKI